MTTLRILNNGNEFSSVGDKVFIPFIEWSTTHDFTVSVVGNDSSKTTIAAYECKLYREDLDYKQTEGQNIFTLELYRRDKRNMDFFLYVKWGMPDFSKLYEIIFTF